MMHLLAKQLHSTIKTAIVRVATAGILLASFSLMTPNIANAYSAPSTAGNSFYVTSAWLNVQSNGHTFAYNEGASGEPNASVVAILDFGRQESTSSGWQVLLTDGTEETQSWVQTVAEDFASGWQSDHSTTLTEAIGTNNSDYAWSNGSSLWATAGTDWANLVDAVANQSYQYIAVYGANDIESWAGSFSNGWVATGTDSTDWCQAYNNVSGSQTTIDYGSEAYVEDPSVWTQQQVYDCAYGYLDDIVLPEIYYSGEATDWQGLYNDYSSLFFNGITSENGAGGTLSWQSGWADLNNATGGNDVYSWATNI